MIKIGICGRAHSGKNTLAQMITKEISARIKTRKSITVEYIAFADPIKEMVSIMFPNLPKTFFYSSSKFRSEIIPGAFKNGSPLTVRQALIDIGTGLGRDYNDSVWLDVFDNTFKKTKKHIIITADVRFPNEFDHLKEKDFFLIKIHRNNNKNINHESETSQDQILDSQFDYVLSNNGSKNDLKLEAINVVNKLNLSI